MNHEKKGYPCHKLLFLLCYIIIVFVSGCASDSLETKKTIKIAYLPITHALPLFAEQEEWNQENHAYDIELVKYGSWPELMDALNTGRIDGAAVLMELAMKAKMQGTDLQAVALGHKDGNVILVDRSIQDASDLKGKSFAIPHRLSSHHILLEELLEQYSLTTNDITIVELSPSEMPSALANGQIAGYCVAEPFGAKAVSMGIGKVLYESKELWEDSICCGLVLRGEFIRQSSEEAKNLVKGYIDAGNRLTLEEELRLGKRYLQQDESVLATSLQWISYKDLTITKEQYEALVNRVTKYELLETCPIYEEFVNQELIKE